MSRSVKYWIGSNDDAMPPVRVRLRISDAHGEKCHRCTKKILVGERWSLDHVVALVNGGANDEKNLAPICSNCLPIKNAADVAEKSRIATKRKRHHGLKKPKRPMPGSRDSKWKRKMDGTVERR